MIKPWGSEQLIEENDRYAVKLITYDAKKRTSLQYHERKLETLYVLRGAIILELDGEERTLAVGQHVTIQPGQVHRVTGGRVSGGQVLETQTPDLDDIVRLEDDYGRAAGTP